MRGGGGMLAKSLLVLAMQAGHTLVDVAAGDEWETAQRGYAQMLGRGNAKQTRLAEQRLRTTRKQLIGASGTDVGLIRKALAIGWANWLADLLEEDPDAEADLQALVQEIPPVPPAGTPSAPRTATQPASSRAVSANGDAIIDAAEAPEPEHPGALAKRSQLAYSIGKAGDAATARDQFTALLPVAERVLGPEHPDTLTNRHNLANFAGYAGDTATARDQFAALLQVRERISGADFHDALVARFNLAYWTGRAGDAAAARDQFA